MKDCLFCKIAQKKEDADIVYEDDKVIAFENIRPLAPVHVLVVPKRHIATVNDISEKDTELIGHIWKVMSKVAEEKQVKNSGYKVAVNVGEGGGQEIFHLHYHLLGGWKSAEERDLPNMP
ncbi:MAG: histidine triad nucleotide-binding protein [Patescibacteria group bacterium]